MAIAYDTGGEAYNSGANNTVSVNVTASAASAVAIVNVYIPSSATAPTSVLVGAVDITANLMVSQVIITGRKIYSYYYVNPPTSSTAYTVNTSGTQDIIIAVQLYSGASQTGVPDASSSNNNGGTGGSSGNFDVTVTATANSWLVACGAGNGNPSASGITGRLTTYFLSGDSDGTVTGSVTTTFTPNANQWAGGIVIALKPVAAAGPANVKTWDGITQSSGIKTYNGVALASVKTWDGIN